MRTPGRFLCSDGEPNAELRCRERAATTRGAQRWESKLPSFQEEKFPVPTLHVPFFWQTLLRPGQVLRLGPVRRPNNSRIAAIAGEPSVRHVKNKGGQAVGHHSDEHDPAQQEKVILLGHGVSPSLFC